MKELICPDCGGECKEYLNKHKCRSCLTEFAKRYKYSTIFELLNDIEKSDIELPLKIRKHIQALCA